MKGSEKKRRRRPKSLIRKNLKQSLGILRFILPPVLSAFISTWLYTRSNIIALPIEGLRIEKATLTKNNDALRLTIEQLQAPHRIEAIARKKLGMIPPEMWQVVVLDKPLRAPETAVHMAETVHPPEPAGWLGFRREHHATPSAARVSPQATGQAG
jgi:cell division protein FtsL